MRWLLAFSVLGILFILLWCKKKETPTIEYKYDTIIKDSIIFKEKEVIKWKEQKSKIIYKTKFDTLATIDTVFVELIKCDSIVKIDSLIINKQDSINTDQNRILESKEKEILDLNKEIKKSKRKLTATKIIAGTLLILSILLK